MNIIEYKLKNIHSESNENNEIKIKLDIFNF